MPLELTAKDFNNWTRRIWHEREKHHFQGKRKKGWDGRFLPEGSRAVAEESLVWTSCALWAPQCRWGVPYLGRALQSAALSQLGVGD